MTQLEQQASIMAARAAAFQLFMGRSKVFKVSFHAQIESGAETRAKFNFKQILAQLLRAPSTRRLSSTCRCRLAREETKTSCGNDDQDARDVSVCIEMKTTMETLECFVRE